MRGAIVAAFFLTLARTVAGQQPVTSDSTKAESSAVAVTPPPPPTPEQQRYLDGLATAGRGIAQLKNGVARVTRAATPARQRDAGQMLAGFCNTAAGYMSRGRVGMKPDAYQDSTLLKARLLVAEIDSLIAYAPTCVRAGAALPTQTAADVTARVTAYEAALRDFRAAVGLPNPPLNK